jgi:hypothetical protein
VEHAPVPYAHPPAGQNTTTSTASYTTKIVTDYTTFCPSPTAVSHNGVIYTVTEATTLSECRGREAENCCDANLLPF